MADQNSSGDTRLEIPEILREDGPALPKPPATERGAMADMAETGQAWAISLDFIVTILVGGLGGWGFDRWRGTSPAGILVGLGLGFAVALMRIIRTTQKQEARDKAARASRSGDSAKRP